MAIKITTKKPLVGNRRSHALNATKHSQKPNNQTITINGETINVDNKREIILDKFTNMLEDKIIEVSFEQVVSSPDTESNSYIKIIAIFIIVIMGYFIFRKRKELFNK